MKTKIIKREKNPFLEREELVLEIENDSTPTSDEVKKEIGKNAELTVIKKINTNFGKQTFIVEAIVYDNAKAKEKIETIPQKIRKKIEADKKTEEETKKKAEEEAKKAAEEVKTAKAPAEEIKEETSTEEKSEESEKPKTEEKAK